MALLVTLNKGVTQSSRIEGSLPPQGSPQPKGNLSHLGTFEYRSKHTKRKVSILGITSRVIPQKILEVSAMNKKGNKRPLIAPPVQSTQKRVGSVVLMTTTITPRKTRGKRRGTHSFLERLITATGTSVSATQNLMGLGATETTEPKKRPEHLPSPLLLANLPLPPAIGWDNTGSCHHK